MLKDIFPASLHVALIADKQKKQPVAIEFTGFS